MCGYCNKNDYVLFQKIKGTLFYLYGGKEMKEELEKNRT